MSWCRWIYSCIFQRGMKTIGWYFAGGTPHTFSSSLKYFSLYLLVNIYYLFIYIYKTYTPLLFILLLLLLLLLLCRGTINFKFIYKQIWIKINNLMSHVCVLNETTIVTQLMSIYLFIYLYIKIKYHFSFELNFAKFTLCGFSVVHYFIYIMEFRYGTSTLKLVTAHWFG